MVGRAGSNGAPHPAPEAADDEALIRAARRAAPRAVEPNGRGTAVVLVLLALAAATAVALFFVVRTSPYRKTAVVLGSIAAGLGLLWWVFGRRRPPAR